MNLKPPKILEGVGMRFLRFRRWLQFMLKLGVNEVYFEQVPTAFAGGIAAQVYGGFLAELTSQCEESRITTYMGVPIQTIKKHATGKGNAKKGRMIQAARDRGWSPVDDNEADALWLLDYAMVKMFVYKLEEDE
jgi:hypothetical protein